MLVRELLQAETRYPVPLAKLKEITLRRELSLEAFADSRTIRSRNFGLAVADLLVWLSIAPNISQGGQSYSFSSEERKQLKKRAHLLYKKLGEEESIADVQYGYKGQYL